MWFLTSTGTIGERWAESYLKKLGLSLIARNWTCRLGEVDLIMREEKTVVFVEVKTRRLYKHSEYNPFSALSVQKKRRVRRAAHHFLSTKRGLLKKTKLHEIRFDIVLIFYQQSWRGRRLARIEHYANAY